MPLKIVVKHQTGPLPSAKGRGSRERLAILWLDGDGAVNIETFHPETGTWWDTDQGFGIDDPIRGGAKPLGWFWIQKNVREPKPKTAGTSEPLMRALAALGVKADEGTDKNGV